MKNTTIAAALAAISMTAAAAPAQPPQQPPSGRDEFMRRQAFEEVQRVSGQVDILESNVNAIAERVARIERGGGEVAALKAEIDALKAELARLRAEMQNQRKEIVDDILKRIKSLPAYQPAPAPAPQPQPRPAPTGPLEEYVVKPNDTLTIIAAAFYTTVPRLRELNGLKGDTIRVGQKLLVPGQGQGRRK